MKTEQELIDYFESQNKLEYDAYNLIEFKNLLVEYYQGIIGLNIDLSIIIKGIKYYVIWFKLPYLFDTGYVCSVNGVDFKSSDAQYVTNDSKTFIELLVNIVKVKSFIQDKYKKYHGRYNN